jgi:hypothetical protein
MKKKLAIILICIVGAILIWNHLPYYYSNSKAADYATNNAAPQSRSMCAGYVIKAMWRGGCPIGLVPAYAYNKILPQIGFKEIPSNDYRPQKGDICVLPQNRKASFGHIAIYNGSQWVSDFKQKSIYPSRPYRENGGAQYFRTSDGWKWKHVWTTPVDWYGWLEAVVKGWKYIKF